jgi:hypothetical protein
MNHSSKCRLRFEVLELMLCCNPPETSIVCSVALFVPCNFTRDQYHSTWISQLIKPATRLSDSWIIDSTRVYLSDF